MLDGDIHFRLHDGVSGAELEVVEDARGGMIDGGKLSCGGKIGGQGEDEFPEVEKVGHDRTSVVVSLGGGRRRQGSNVHAHNVAHAVKGCVARSDVQL